MSIGKDIPKTHEQQLYGDRLHSMRNPEGFLISSRLKSCFGEQDFPHTIAARASKVCQYQSKIAISAAKETLWQLSRLH